MSPFFRQSRNVILAALILSGAAAPAFAEDPTAIANRAVDAYNNGVAAERAGDYAQACISYRDAAKRFESAIYSLVGEPMQTEDQRESVKAYANDLQKKIDAAKAHASQVCNK